MTISSHQIDLWFAYNEKINDPALLSQYLDMLSESERVQQKRFHFEKHRHQYLITRALVRSVLSRYDDSLKPSQWEFSKNNYGKPSISNAALKNPVQFNLSHTDELIVMAVTKEKQIGVDVEYLPRLGKTLDIANHFFSPSEASQLLALPVEQQRNRFFDLWTLKEAYIKACGMGLSIPLDHFSFSFSPQGKIHIEFIPERNDRPELWQFWQVQPSDIHKVAVALKDDITCRRYSINLHEIVPLSEIVEVSYPVSYGGVIEK
jgi:4'-phosphopantetheinyl transferase